jgi:hypothetical protein
MYVLIIKISLRLKSKNLFEENIASPHLLRLPANGTLISNGLAIQLEMILACWWIQMLP